MTGPVQVADLREQFKGREDLAEVVHVLHHGKHFTIYIATAKSTGLKVLLKAYDIGKLVIRKVHSFSPHLTHLLASCMDVSAPAAFSLSCLGLGICTAASGLAVLLPLCTSARRASKSLLSLAARHPSQMHPLPQMSCTNSRAPVRQGTRTS